MITNERQERITKSEIRKFEAALAALNARELEADSNDEEFRLIQIDALSSQLNDLRGDVAAYEALKAQKLPVLELDSIDQLPEALIAARIASGLTQEQLSKKVGVHEQQIQRYEATRYSSASWARLKEVARALDVGVREDVLLPVPSAGPATFLRRLEEVGVEREIVLRRILSPQIAAELESFDDKSNGQGAVTMQAASSVAKVLGLHPSVLLGTDPIYLNAAAVGAARFSVRANANERRLMAYTVYAHYLARIVINATPDLEPRHLPIDPVEFRSQVADIYGEFGFEQVLRFAWDLGIAVLPLSDPGAFQGALWRIGGRNIIVLKRRAEFVSRSLIDLLHELRHAGEQPDLPEFSVIEEGESLRDRKKSKGERRAVHFAVASALSGREEELAASCYQEAAYRVERLTSVVPRIAIREAIDVGVLADYLAYRLAFEQPPVDWWGAATNLQPRAVAPWNTARRILLERTDLSRVTSFDRELLTRALSELGD